MARTAQSERLDRIEEKIDKLADAMVSIARAEEKIISMEKRFDYLEEERKHERERFEDMHQKLDSIEASVAKNGSTINIINKLFWVIAVSAIGVLTTQFFTI